MDSINFRKSKAIKFFSCIQINITPELEFFLKDLGVNIVEDLKLLEEKDWKNCSSILKMNFIEHKRLSKSVKMLNESSSFDPFIGAQLDINNVTKIPNNKPSNLNKQNTTTSKKKKVSSLGGNLQQITSFFQQNQSSKSKEDNILCLSSSNLFSSDNNDGIDGTTFAGVIESESWQVKRSDCDPLNELNKVLNPSLKYEKVAAPMCNDFEGIYGCYKLIGDDIS